MRAFSSRAFDFSADGANVSVASRRDKNRSFAVFRPMLITFLLYAAFPVTAFAVPVKWEIHAVFQGGAEAVGTFTLDVDTEQVWDIDITSNPGPAECYDGNMFIPCVSPGAHYTEALFMNFHLNSDGSKSLRYFGFVSEGNLSDAFTWDARFLQRFDGACAYGGSERPEWCTYGPGNEGGSIEIYEDSHELQCGGLLYCIHPTNDRRMAYVGGAHIINYVVGTVLPFAADDGPIAAIDGVAKAISVGANDANFANPVTVTVTTLPTKGTITAISSPGPAAGMTVTYTANVGAVGADSFVYEMTDSSPAADSATVTLDISPDTDGDGVVDQSDNCTLVANAQVGNVPGTSIPKYQLDSDNDGYGNACDADLNNSGLVTAADFAVLRSVLNELASYSPLSAAADLNGSGTVTATDFAILRGKLNTAPGPSGWACAGTVPCP